MELGRLRAALDRAPSVETRGRVLSVEGLALRVVLPGVRLGDVLEIQRPEEVLLAEVVGFRGSEAVALPLGELRGVGPDDPVVGRGEPLQVGVGPHLLGRVLDGLGRPIDGGPALSGAGRARAVHSAPPPALSRRPVTEPLVTGLRVLDGLLTLGVGQRVGLFAGSGVGKSTLLAALARAPSIDVVVLALVGERGREVGELLGTTLDAATRQQSVAVVSTSDAPALERLRAAELATAIAEGFRDDGRKVLLLLDSVTRVARAQREVGLAAGEPPTRRGYPPSVFAMLPRLLERSGQGAQGSITAVYAVLAEGDDLDEPIADEVRGILDGHIVLSRALAARGRYPAVDVVASVSRVMPSIVGPAERRDAQRLRAALACYEEKRDLLTLGAYTAGSDPVFDRALALAPQLEAFLAQAVGEQSPYADTRERVAALARRAGP